MSTEKYHPNDKKNLIKKLKELKTQLDFIERLDITTSGHKLEGDEDDDDFKRENYFKSQALVTIGIANSNGIKFGKPDDYFAQMLKSDEHMDKVNKRFLAEQKARELSAKAKKIREMKKLEKAKHKVKQTKKSQTGKKTKKSKRKK